MDLYVFIYIHIFVHIYENTCVCVCSCVYVQLTTAVQTSSKHSCSFYFISNLHKFDHIFYVPDLLLHAHICIVYMCVDIFMHVCIRTYIHTDVHVVFDHIFYAPDLSLHAHICIVLIYSYMLVYEHIYAQTYILFNKFCNAPDLFLYVHICMVYVCIYTFVCLCTNVYRGIDGHVVFDHLHRRACGV